jgi:hypothetical protein
MSKRKVLYLKSEWIDNIGNAFIDMGAIMSLKSATYDNISIIPLSHYPFSLLSGYHQLNPLLSLSFSSSIIKHLIPFLKGKNKSKIMTKKDISKNIQYTLDIVSSVSADFIIMSGAILTETFFNITERMLNRLKNNHIKIIFYGCSGDYYSDIEVEYVRKKLDEIEPYALITRDSIAFKYYKDLAEFSYDGIDCGFFVNYYNIQETEINLPPYIVLTFDDPNNIINIEVELERELSQKYMIVKAIHSVDPRIALLRFSLHSNKSNILISDSPIDYLLLYSHAQAVYTDRVHATVATLAFSNPCRLYTKSPRAKLFERVGAEDVDKKLVSIDMNKLKSEQEKQIEFISEIFNKY